MSIRICKHTKKTDNELRINVVRKKHMEFNVNLHHKNKYTFSTWERSFHFVLILIKKK